MVITGSERYLRIHKVPIPRIKVRLRYTLPLYNALLIMRRGEREAGQSQEGRIWLLISVFRILVAPSHQCTHICM